MGYPTNHKYGSKGYKKEDTSEVIAKHHGTEGLELRIHEDGTVEAEGFKDKSSDGLEYDELQGNAGFTFHKPLDENTELYYVPNSVRRYYSTTVSIYHAVKDAFARFRGAVTKLVVTDLLRYKKAKKSLKTTITKLAEKKHHFIFTTRSLDGDSWYPIPYSHSWSVGPYNYPTELKVTKTIDNLNDLLVVKTGTFMSHWSSKNKTSLLTPYDEKVVYVSPHELYGVSGSVYTYLGSGLVTKDAVIRTLTSNHVVIPEGEKLYSGTSFYDIRQEDLTLLHDGENPSRSLYSTQYVKSKNSFLGEWDGIIPSGAYARIETVSMDGKYLGFDGEISVVQYSGNGDEKIDIDCGGTFTGVGVDAQYEYSVSKAVEAARKKYYKKLKLLLVELGVRNKTAKMKRYERMLGRVAQNVYDGFGTVRNEKVGAAQGTESSPIGSPIFYDGILNMYGGSRVFSNYNYADIYLDKITNPIAHILYPPSGIYAGALSAGGSISSSTQRTSPSVGGGGGGGYTAGGGGASY